MSQAMIRLTEIGFVGIVLDLISGRILAETKAYQNTREAIKAVRELESIIVCPRYVLEEAKREESETESWIK